MKVVDKYGLAKQPYGTMFYNLDKYGNIEGGLRILASNTYYYDDDKPEFLGVVDIEPDTVDVQFYMGYEDNLGDLFYWDDSSTDYDDTDMFLVLTKDEALQIINLVKDLVEGKSILYYHGYIQTIKRKKIGSRIRAYSHSRR